MTSPLVLVFPDFTQEFVIETNAFGGGIGAILMQQGRPLAYFNKDLFGKYRGLLVYEKEMLAIVVAMQKWRVYILEASLIAILAVTTELLHEIQNSRTQDDRLQKVIQQLASSSTPTLKHYTWNQQLRRMNKEAININLGEDGDSYGIELD
ncbi:hypothetical protein ACH5RR_015981 [Cinchona calisaya]|uniref:Reverse transcriptase RNase H-like domain-containing protein n=1 Tax=Cinchona calisaya TaxID=153742 RepID=A0ABD2ZXC3_9GENT